VSRFYWPEPDLSFLPGAKAIGEGEARYFVCHNNNILQLVDEKEAWRPATREELGQFDGVHEHYMGTLSGKKCFAVHVSEPGSAGFASLRMNIQNIGPTLFNLAGRALQVCDWYRNHQFCGRCGKPTTDSKRDRSTVCAGCKLNFYPRLSPSIIVLVHRGDEVLLGRNHMFPEGLFSTLAGFVEPGESIEETVIREVKEEVGVNVSNLSYRGSQPWPFPNSLMLGFHAEYQSGDIVLQEDEIAEAGWFPCTDLPLIPGKFAISRWLIDEYLSQHDISV
jgi:NAD+ diphosphatase